MTGVTPKPVNQQPEIGSLSLFPIYLQSAGLILLCCYLLFLGQGEMSPGGDGHPAITGVAASAHDAQPVIVTHSAIAAVAELIDFIWKIENNKILFSRGIFLIFGDVTPSEFQFNHEIKDRNFHE